MVDEFLLPRPEINPFEDHSSIGIIEVVIFQVNAHTVIPRQVNPAEIVRREGAVIERNKPIGMLNDPTRIDTHVIGNHIRCQADAALPGAIVQFLIGFIATQVGSDLVIEQ